MSEQEIYRCHGCHTQKKISLAFCESCHGESINVMNETSRHSLFPEQQIREQLIDLVSNAGKQCVDPQTDDPTELAFSLFSDLNKVVEALRVLWEQK